MKPENNILKRIERISISIHLKHSIISLLLKAK